MPSDARWTFIRIYSSLSEMVTSAPSSSPFDGYVKWRLIRIWISFCAIFHLRRMQFHLICVPVHHFPKPKYHICCSWMDCAGHSDSYAFAQHEHDANETYAFFVWIIFPLCFALVIIEHRTQFEFNSKFYLWIANRFGIRTHCSMHRSRRCRNWHSHYIEPVLAGRGRCVLVCNSNSEITNYRIFANLIWTSFYVTVFFGKNNIGGHKIPKCAR